MKRRVLGTRWKKKEIFGVRDTQKKENTKKKECKSQPVIMKVKNTNKTNEIWEKKQKRKKGEKIRKWGTRSNEERQGKTLSSCGEKQQEGEKKYEHGRK